MQISRKQPLSHNEAQSLALTALRFLAANAALWSRFEALTGVDAAAAAGLADDAGFQAGVLEFLLQHEPDLLMFCSQEMIPPERPAQACRILGETQAGA